jgi:hypothetical protein
MLERPGGGVNTNNNDACGAARGPHGASHPEWAYRREAIVWLGDVPAKPNLVPFAGEMALWTQQKIHALPLHTKLSAELTCQPNNPYTYSLGAISLALGSIINDAFGFAESAVPIDPVDAEVIRIRYESELIIYSARFCEAAIKQMLYCTQVPLKMYEKASMGQLLARPCERCKKAGKKGHDISLLGALAHRFFLCHMLDGCALDHLQLVARRRNLEAAHSDSQSIHPRTAAESRSNLANSLREIGHELGHMAEHIGEIEEKMIAEATLSSGATPWCRRSVNSRASRFDGSTNITRIYETANEGRDHVGRCVGHSGQLAAWRR